VRRMLLAVVLGALLAMLIAGGVAFAQDITGTPASEELIGTPDPDTIDALGGDDRVYGLGGHDTLYGRNGDDVIRGDAAPEGYTDPVGDPDWDVLFGGNGADNLAGNAGVDVLYAGNDNSPDVLRGGADADVYVVDRAAYEEGVDVIFEDQSLAKGKRLPKNATPQDLHDRAVKEGQSLLYFYPD
jgi:Ca2+-binding RTX toxin-like protein